jgi:hypothetical protein
LRFLTRRGPPFDLQPQDIADEHVLRHTPP